MALKHFFSTQKATVLMLDDLTADVADKTVHSVAHGVVRLEELSPEYGPERRRMRVIKYRGRRFRGGFHDFVIDTGGVRAFPRLVSSEHKLHDERFWRPMRMVMTNHRTGKSTEMKWASYDFKAKLTKNDMESFSLGR